MLQQYSMTYTDKGVFAIQMCVVWCYFVRLAEVDSEWLRTVWPIVQIGGFVVVPYILRRALFFLFILFYFKVDNRYVVNKLKVVLLPVMKKDWYRLPSEDEVKDDVGGRPNVLE